MDVCTYSIFDGDGDAATGTVTITVEANKVVIKLPGAGSALDPWSLALLCLVPLARLRKRFNQPSGNEHSGVK